MNGNHEPSVRDVVHQFAHLLYEVRDVAGAFGRFVRDDYIQHSPGLPDGPAAAVEALERKFADPGLRLTVRRIIIDGDVAVILIHGEVGASSRFAVVDVYRFEGNAIVEHWDVKEVFPEVVHNDHPFFT